MNLQTKEKQGETEETKVGVVVMEVDETRGTEEECDYTLDGAVDFKGHPALKGKSGGWLAGTLILGNPYS